MANKNKVDVKYLTPNYDSIAKMINDIHGTDYASRNIKFIHKGNHARTQNTIKVEIDSMVGLYSDWFDSEGKKLTI